MSRTVRVGLGDAAYDVVVGHGLLDEAGVQVAPFLKRGRTAVVSDETVWALHGAALTARAERRPASRRSRSSCRPASRARAGRGLADVCDRLLALELDRGDLIIAFGGGVVGDLAGFAAVDLQARHRLRPDPHHPAGPGGLLGGRQDRHRHPARQEPDRRLPPARGWCWPTWTCWPPCRTARCAPATPR